MARKKSTNNEETITPDATPPTDTTTNTDTEVTPSSENAEVDTTTDNETNSAPELTDEDVVRLLVGDAQNTTLDNVMSETSAPTPTPEDAARFNELVENAIEDRNLSHEELNEKYAPTIQEGINFLRSAITARGHRHADEMFSLINHIEKISNY